MEENYTCTREDGSKVFDSFRFSQTIQDKKMAQKARMKDKLNKVVLEYLVQEGYQSAAFKFSEEAKIPLTQYESLPNASPPVMCEKSVAGMNPNWPSNSNHGKPAAGFSGDKSHVNQFKGFSSIEKRKHIKFLILKGNISEAIRVLSTHYPAILDSNNLLLFKLLRLNLIEMIRSHKASSKLSVNADSPVSAETNEESEKSFLSEILNFVRTNLLNKVTHSMELLRQLEITMSLLCFEFDHDNPSSLMNELPEELRKLLDLSLRNECYRTVNRVILDLDSSIPPTILFHGLSAEKLTFSSAQIDIESCQNEDLGDSDRSDVELSPGPDVIKSIESMISAVPEIDIRTLAQVDSMGEETELDRNEASSRSKLEEIAHLWLATESILFSDDHISKKRYLQDQFEDHQRL